MAKKGKRRCDTLPVLHPDAAGIDVGASELYVAVSANRDPQPVRSFPTFTRDLHALADWLVQCGIRSVAMESIQVLGPVWSFDDTKRKRSRRIVKLQSFVLMALEAERLNESVDGLGSCRSVNDLIFVTGSGSPLKQRVVKREFRRLLANAGIRPVRLYDLRHTAATLGIAAGISVKVIADQLGHAISFTLERYSHVLPSIQDEAAAKVERLLVA